MLIGSSELSKRSGVTYRKIDWWVHQGVIESESEINIGTGARRKFDSSIIPKIKLLDTISLSFGPNSLGVDKELLKRLYNNYKKGQLYITEDVVLTWVVRTEEDEDING